MRRTLVVARYAAAIRWDQFFKSQKEHFACGPLTSSTDSVRSLLSREPEKHGRSRGVSGDTLPFTGTKGIRQCSREFSSKVDDEENDDALDEGTMLHEENESGEGMELYGENVDSKPAEVNESDEEGVIPMEIYGENADNKSVKKLWSRVAKAIPERKYNVVNIIKKWMKEGHEPTRKNLTIIISRLRRRMRFKQALQICKWMLEEKPCPVIDADVVTRLYLTARAGRSDDAVKLLKQLPPHHQNEVTYTILLTGYTSKNQVKKAEILWKQMKQMGLVKSPHGYNNMLLMYKRKGLDKDLRTLYVEMVLSPVPPDALTFLILLRCRHAIGGFEGIEEKAAAAVKALETQKLQWSKMEALIRIYGYLGDLDGVERMWTRLQKNPGISTNSFLCAMDAFGQAGAIDRAEDVFRMMEAETKNVFSRQYFTMINVYSRAGMTEKAEELLKRMIADGRKPSAVAYNPLILACLKHNEFDKALALFDSAMAGIKEGRTVALYSSILAIMNIYAQRGDVKAAEALVSRCKEAKYFTEVKLYNALLKVYLNAQSPAYGIEDRLKAHSVQPDDQTRELITKLKAMT